MFALFGGDDSSDESDRSFHVEDGESSSDEDGGDQHEHNIHSARDNSPIKSTASSSDDAATEEGRSSAAAGTSSSVPSSARSNRSRGSIRSSAVMQRAATSTAAATETSSDSEEGARNNNASDDDENSTDTKLAPLTDSSRLKGYITLIVASVVHYDAAKDSSLGVSGDEEMTVSVAFEYRGVVPADPAQRSYAMAVSVITLIVAMFCAVVHFDRFTCLKGAWESAFGPGSKIELSILLGLSLWWLIATIVLTSVTGIAGPGKGHYNLYFATWTCLWTSLWTLERWLVAANFSSMTKFLEAWPNRAPGWIITFINSLAALLATVDLFINWPKLPERLQFGYVSVSQHQWVWLLFVPAVTIPISATFFLIELFRVSQSDGQNLKSDRENFVEGLCITILALFWTPTLFIATTPGGAADQTGNAYFFIWFSSIVVTETFLWWVRDWRTAVHTVMRMQQEEYKRTQEKVLKNHQQEVEERLADGDSEEARHLPVEDTS